MGVILEQKPVKLITSIIFKEGDFLRSAEEELIKRYGVFEACEKTLPFDFTDYYDGEFGGPLMRKLRCFKDLVEHENIPAIKKHTNQIEDMLRVDNKRTVNVDPGYITEAKLVLLSTKDYIHRMYVGKNIFAEITLYFQDNKFNPWPWTYPDYASQDMLSYFKEVREMYMLDIRCKKHESQVK